MDFATDELGHKKVARQMAKMVGENVDLIPAVRPALETLRDQTGQTAVFATVLDGKMTMIDFTLGTTLVQFAFAPGAKFNLNSSALKQAKRYSSGILAGFELKSLIYISLELHFWISDNLPFC